MRIGWSLLATNTSGVHPLSCLPRWPPREHYHSVRGTVVCVYVRVEHNVQLGVLTPRPVYRGNAIPIPGLWQCDSIESDSSSGRHASVDFNPPGLCLVVFRILSFSRLLDFHARRSKGFRFGFYKISMHLRFVSMQRTIKFIYLPLLLE